MTKIPRLDATLCFVNEDRLELEAINEEDEKNKKNENEDNGMFDFCIILKSFNDNRCVQNFRIHDKPHTKFVCGCFCLIHDLF